MKQKKKKKKRKISDAQGSKSRQSGSQQGVELEGLMSRDVRQTSTSEDAKPKVCPGKYQIEQTISTMI